MTRSGSDRPAPDRPATERDAAVAEVLSAERAWTDAHLSGDVAAIERLMADDYVKIQPDGSLLRRAEALASYVPEKRSWEFARSDEHDVRVQGDTAIVIGRWTARGENQGVRFDYAARFLSVYVRHGGRWRMAAEQSTEIAPPEGDRR